MMNVSISTTAVTTGQAAGNTQAASGQVQVNAAGVEMQGANSETFLLTLRQAMTMGLNPQALVALQQNSSVITEGAGAFPMLVQLTDGEEQATELNEQLNALLQLLETLDAQLEKGNEIPAAEETWILLEDILEQMSSLLLQQQAKPVQADQPKTAPDLSLKEQIQQLMPILRQMSAAASNNEANLTPATKQQLHVLMTQLDTITRHILATSTAQHAETADYTNNVQPVLTNRSTSEFALNGNHQKQFQYSAQSDANSEQETAKLNAAVMNRSGQAVQMQDATLGAEQAEQPAAIQETTASKGQQMEAAVSVKSDLPVHKGTADAQVSQPVKMHAHQFADEMSRLVKSMNLSHQNGISEAKIILMPETLGQVEVRISMQNGVMTAQFMADTMLGKDALETQLLQLRSSLQQQGLQVDKLEVTQSSVFAGMNQEQQRQGFGQPSSSSKSNKEKVDAYEQAALIDEWAEDSDIREEVREGGFHATA